MSFSLYIDKDTNDFVLDKGTLRLTQNKPEILRQRLSVSFKTFTGEWFNNIAFGAIDRDILFRKGVTRAEVDAHFKSIVLGFEEVNSIVEWDSELNPATRDYDLRYVVSTDYGDVRSFVTTQKPEIEIEYTVVPSPAIAATCVEYVDLANRLHEALPNFGLITENWILETSVLNPDGVIHTSRIIEN